MRLSKRDDELVDEMVDKCTDILYLGSLIRRHSSGARAASKYLGADYCDLKHAMDGSLESLSHEQIKTYIDLIHEAVELGVIIG